MGADLTFVLDVPAEVERRLQSADGRQVASGVYLYKLGVHPAGAPPQEFTGKLAQLR